MLSLALTALSVIPFATPAHAAEGVYGTTFVDGAGSLTDDFGDHYNELGHYLCNGCPGSWNTDLVVMWQAILFAENKLGVTEIDGKFGPRTHSATVAWQQLHGLPADGVVGPSTWGKADGRLKWAYDSRLKLWFVEYDALAGSGYVRFYRGKTGVYGSSGSYYFWGAAEGGDAAEPYPLEGANGLIHFHKRTIGIMAHY